MHTKVIFFTEKFAPLKLSPYVCGVERVTMIQVDKTITAGKSTLALKPRTTSYLNRDRRETYMDVLSILMSYRIAKR